MLLKQTIHIAIYEYQQYQILCQIQIKPRTIQIYKERARLDHRWFENSLNWHRFEAELQRVLDKYEWSDRDFNGEFYLDKTIKIKFKASSRMPDNGLWQQKDIALALECVVEFSENCKCSRTQDEPIIKRRKDVRSSSRDAGDAVETRSGSRVKNRKELPRFHSLSPCRNEPRETKAPLSVDKPKIKKAKHKVKKNEEHATKLKINAYPKEGSRSKDLVVRLEKPTTSKQAKQNLENLRIDSSLDSEKLRRKQDERVDELLKQLNAIPVTPDPAKVDILPLSDMASEQVLNTFDLYKTKIDEVCKDLRGKSIVDRYKGLCHVDVIDLLSQDIQMKMMNRVAEAYSMPPSGKTSSWITNAVLPIWIANIFMDRYKMNLQEAIKHIKAQQEYKDFLKHKKDRTSDFF